MNHQIADFGPSINYGLDTGMIKSAKISNFRCYKSVTLSDLGTINVVVGRNASGKTALLEAIYLASGNSPELAQKLRAWRGLANLVANNTDGDKQTWIDLFPNFDFKNQPHIELRGDTERILHISYDETEGMSPVTMGTGQIQPLLASPIKFLYSSKGIQFPPARVAPIGPQMVTIGPQPIAIKASFFASSVGFDLNETIDRFSKLLIAKQSKELVAEIVGEFPFIKDIEVAVRFGGGDFYLDVDNVAQKVPLGLVSGGVSKIIHLLVAIFSNPDGIIIIDEIENGVYFDRYEALWKAIYKAASLNRVQIFASTHSDECLRALSRASESWQDEVSFIRTLSSAEGKTVEQFSASTIFGAMEIGEVR